jgi:flagellin
MYPLQTSSIALEGIYSGMFAEINNLVSSVLLSGAVEFVPSSDNENYILAAISENASNMENITAGTSLLQANIEYLEQIKEKLEEMKEIAEDADTGSYSSGQLAELQDQMESLAEDIDDIAAGELGETHLLTSDFGSEEISIGSGLYVTVNTHDMTSQGLDVDNIDVTIDPQAAIDAVQDGIDEVLDYDAYLDSKVDDLGAVALALDMQSQSLLAAQSVVESTESAVLLLSALNNDFFNATQLLLITQANSANQTVLQLLTE